MKTNFQDIVDKVSSAVNENKYSSSYLALKFDGGQGLYDNFILLEGKNDRQFFMRFNKKDNKYIVIEDVLRSLNALNEKYGTNEDNNKKIIIDLIKNANFFNCFNGKKIYGIIDKDYDEEYPHNYLKNLFSDSVHDLETMLFNSDKGLCQKLQISDNVFDKALFMAYQIGTFRKVIAGKFHYRLPKFDFSQIFSGDKLLVSQFMTAVNKHGEGKGKIKCEDVIKKNILFDHKGNLKTDFDSFRADPPQDLFGVINGHDLTRLISYLVKAEITSKMLIEHYNLDSFNKSNLHSKLCGVNII